MNKKRGISLITLIITIIVIIILAGAVILSLNNTNIIENANKAKLLNKIQVYKEVLNLYKQDKLLSDYNYDSSFLQAKEDSILDIIPNITESDKSKFEIINGELVFKPSSEEEKEFVNGVVPIKPSDVITAKITYDANGGIGGPKEAIGKNYWFEHPVEVPTKDNKVFIMWYPKKFNGVLDVKNDINNGNMYNLFFIMSPLPFSGYSKLYAIYDNKGATITFDGNGGKVDTVKQDCGEYVSLLSSQIPTKEGKFFAGWNTRLDGKGEQYMPLDPVELKSDMKLYAMWTAEKYTLTYKINQSNNIIPKQIGKIVKTNFQNLIVDDEKVIFTWNTKEDGSGNVYIPGQCIELTQDTILYPQYKNLVTIKYDSNNGSGDVLIEKGLLTLTRNKIFKAPTEKHKFIGWATDKEGMEKIFLPSSMMILFNYNINNITLYSIWLEPKTILFNANGGINAPEKLKGINVGDALKIPIQKPERSRYIFKGWNTQIDGKGKTYMSGDSIIVPEEGIVLYAIWKSEPS